MPEQRREPRIALSIPVDLGFARGVTRDLSESGCLVDAVLDHASPSDAVDFSLMLAMQWGQIERRCKGRIVRMVPNGATMGIGIAITESTMLVHMAEDAVMINGQALSKND